MIPARFHEKYFIKKSMGQVDFSNPLYNTIARIIDEALFRQSTLKHCLLTTTLARPVKE
jgi:hypothetical protein